MTSPEGHTDNMRTICGYRLSDDQIPALGEFVDRFRADALRILSRNYSIAVADEAVRRIDFHRSSISPRDSDASPIREATALVRDLAVDNESDLDLDCRVVVHFVDGHVLLRLADGIGPYRQILEAQPGITPYHLGPQPDPITPEWAEREARWDAAFPTPRLGVGLSFQLIDGTLPAPRWTSVKRAVPAYDKRIKRTTRAWLWNASSFKATNDLASFRSWLATPKGKASYQETQRLIERLLITDFERDDLVQYGDIPDTRRSKPRPFNGAQATGSPGPIDHADIMESSDGRVFVAVMDANLSPEDRLFLQVAEQTLSFVQAGKDYGQIAGVPNAAIDLLRGTKEVTVVEIRRVGGRKELKAKHVALIRDASPADDLSAVMNRWRSNAKASTKPQAKWADR